MRWHCVGNGCGHCSVRKFCGAGHRSLLVNNGGQRLPLGETALTTNSTDYFGSSNVQRMTSQWVLTVNMGQHALTFCVKCKHKKME